MKLTVRLSAFALSAMLVLSACGSDGDGETPDGAGTEGAGESLRIAAIFSGPTTDADYNALGLLALEAAEQDGHETTFSEAVPVPDVERVLQEYVSEDYDVIWTHGSQFYDATAAAAEANPEVVFIGEFDGEQADAPENVWIVDRNFHTAFYPIGALAAALSESGEVGYVGGLSLPFSYSEVHAMEQAISDAGTETTINPVWTGDFNDPAKAQQITSQLVSQGADVIVGSLNLGIVGAFQAVEGETPGEVWLTTKYTDKSQFGEEHYAGSVIYDFAGPLEAIIADIGEGTTGGYYPLGFDTGVEIQVADTVDADVRAQVEKVVAQMESGEVTIERNVEPIE